MGRSSDDRKAARKYIWLPIGTLREVARHARQGRPHPDPEVAAMALTWARTSRPTIWHVLAAAGGFVAVALFMQAVLDGPSPLTSGALGGLIGALVWLVWARRHADRILSVEARATGARPERPGP
jgi:hypothetical protein